MTRRDRNPYATPSFAPGVMEALQVSIERYTRGAMRGVQGSIPCGEIKFCHSSPRGGQRIVYPYQVGSSPIYGAKQNRLHNLVAMES